MAAYRRIVVETPFPLDGESRERGAREPNRTSPLPLSFPVKGKDQDAVAGRFLYNSATSTALTKFSKENTKLTKRSWFKVQGRGRTLNFEH
jgi:hypothetical protein